MPVANAVELERFRRKIGDQQKKGFTDPELQDIWDEAGGDLTKATLIAFEELWANAVRFADYTANESSVKKSQIFNNIEKMLKRLDGKVTRRNPVRIVGTEIVPNRNAERPSTDSDDEFHRGLW
jgi:hypothetical protein